MKKTFSTLLVAILATVALTVLTPAAHAQRAGLVKAIDGASGLRILPTSTNVVASSTATNYYGAPGTSTNLTVTVQEFDKVGFTWSYTGGNNGTVALFKSYDGGTTYEAVPSYTYAGPTSGVAAYSTNALLDLTGASHVAISMRNAGSVSLTNNAVTFNLKSPKYGAKVSTQ